MIVSMLTMMVMKLFGVAGSLVAYSANDDYEHEHRYAEQEQEGMPGQPY